MSLCFVVKTKPEIEVAKRRAKAFVEAWKAITGFGPNKRIEVHYIPEKSYWCHVKWHRDPTEEDMAQKVPDKIGTLIKERQNGSQITSTTANGKRQKNGRPDATASPASTGSNDGRI